MGEIFGRLQFVASDRRVFIDLCADLCDVDGFPRAVTSPCVSDSKRPYWLLERAIEVAETTDERQPALLGGRDACRVGPPHSQSERTAEASAGASGPRPANSFCVSFGSGLT